MLKGLVDLDNLPIVTEDDNTDVVRLQVEGHTLNAGLELHHLTGLDLGETEDSGDTVTNGDGRTELLQIVLFTRITKLAAADALSWSPPQRVSGLSI